MQETKMEYPIESNEQSNVVTDGDYSIETIPTDNEIVEIDLNYIAEALEGIEDEEEAAAIIKKTLPKFSNAQVRRYLKLMSRHKPGKEKEKAAKKATNRAKNKSAKQARRQNRK